MLTETEGIVLRQVNTVNGRRMLTLFSKKYGKISLGTTIGEGGKSKAALLMRPFTYGRYELYKNRENYNYSSGQVIKSYYEIGEDLDKFTAAGFVLELTDKLLPAELPNPKLFVQLEYFFELLSQRKTKHDTLVVTYMAKALDILGAFPVLDRCACCQGPLKSEMPGASGAASGESAGSNEPDSRESAGSNERDSRESAGSNEPDRGESAGSDERDSGGRAQAGRQSVKPAVKQYFSVKDGGMICPGCFKKIHQTVTDNQLIYESDFDIISILEYCKKESFRSFEKIGLDDEIAGYLRTVLLEHIRYHFDIGKLKSEEFEISI